MAQKNFKLEPMAPGDEGGKSPSSWTNALVKTAGIYLMRGAQYQPVWNLADRSTPILAKINSSFLRSCLFSVKNIPSE